MANNEEDDTYVMIEIGRKLKDLNSRPCRLCPFKVPDELLTVNKKAYEPEIISIGPNHRHKDYLKPMEECKFRYLQMLLRRRNEDSAARYVKAMRALEDKARCCYEELASLNKDAFVEMMVLDGCFIIELIRKHELETLRDVDDPIFQSRMIISKLKRDMLLLENQLPFFVLSELFRMTATSDQEMGYFFQQIFNFFSTGLLGGCRRGDDPSVDNFEHLLGFVHDSWLPSKERLKAYKHISPVKMESIPAATKLEEAGIKFRKNQKGSLFDIEFEKGRMLIPTINIDDQTETILRNLIAYEQFSKGVKRDHVLDYTTVMDYLIDSAKDVELLQQHGIIVNWLGNNQAVATLFNRLGHHVVHAKTPFYSETLKKVNEYCERRWNKQMANLRHKYLNSPWAFISFLAAVFLLLLTLLQTIYSFFSYYKQ